MKTQVMQEHYDFNNYVDTHRWNSYYYQIYEALKCKGNNILYIGIGDGIVVDTLRKNGKDVTTLDFDKNLKPDICGSVTEIDKLIKHKYDVIICCQVLEHIPFDKFDSIMEKLSKNVKEKLILSLPNCYSWLRINIDCWKIHIHLKMPIKRIIKYRKWDFVKDGKNEHYWEIGSKDINNKTIKNNVKKYFVLEKKFITSNNTYHYFYILSKNGEKL